MTFGPVEIEVPRDRDASFSPQIVAKRQRRLSGVEDLVGSLSAKGLTHGEISAHRALQLDREIRRIVCTTERARVGQRPPSAARSVARAHFPTEHRPQVRPPLAVLSLHPTGTGQSRWVTRRMSALNAFDIAFDERLFAARR
jgi:transposase-like protein